MKTKQLNTELKPQFILNKNKVFENYNLLKTVCDEISYSWKTNIDVSKILNENETCFMSIHSVPELEQVKNKNKVWYFGFAWNNDALDTVIGKYGVKNFVVDNTDDLNVLLRYIEKKKVKVNVLLRMKLKENTIFTGKHFVFGMHVEKIKELIPQIEQHKFIDKIGVHFHRKTQNISEWSLKSEVCDALGDDILDIIDFINIGGGLPGEYKNSHIGALKGIFDKILQLKEYANSKGVKIIVEPGRFIASSAVKLKTQIIAIHSNTIFLNCSIFNGMLDTVVANVKLLVENELEKGTRYLLKGCTPDSCDILRYSVYLDNPKVGDTIVFLNCGAYNFTTDFCALKQIDVVLE